MKFVEAGKLKDNLANYLRDLPKWLRFALIFAPYVTLFYFDLSFWGQLYGALMVLFAFYITPDAQGDKLRVGLEQVPSAKLKRVAVGEYNKSSAILSFPFNYQISHHYVFPIQQLDSVREFFKTNYPQVDLIT
jgi:fatty acid desaturase